MNVTYTSKISEALPRKIGIYLETPKDTVILNQMPTFMQWRIYDEKANPALWNERN